MVEAAAEVDGGGGTALIVPIGASTGLGSLGYATAALELVAQLDGLDRKASTTRVFVPSSSCGTLAGLVLGLALLGRDDVRLVAVSADADAEEIQSRALQIAAEGADLLQASVPLADVDVLALDGQVGQGYGIPTDASHEATRLFATLEGLVLDPTYTAKAAAGMIDWIREHGASPDERIVFLHTGGHPGLLA
jgi:1-aminocyclopropane-1-carboxylate deaminase/D-cysteine desulfhydrase-like pyridoxal-dependent ACC family enzyme